MSRFLTTASGKKFYPEDMENSEFSICDIAQGLSNLCRFSGQCSEFYSVAQHSVLVSQIVPEEYALEGLLHDATEAYMNDLPRAIKYLCNDYIMLEDKLSYHLAKKFGFEYPFHKSIKEADCTILATEFINFFKENPTTYKAIPLPIVPLEPKDAKNLFLHRYEEIMRIKYDIDMNLDDLNEWKLQYIMGHE